MAISPITIAYSTIDAPREAFVSFAFDVVTTFSITMNSEGVRSIESRCEIKTDYPEIGYDVLVSSGSPHNLLTRR